MEGKKNRSFVRVFQMSTVLYSLGMLAVVLTVIFSITYDYAKRTLKETLEDAVYDAGRMVVEYGDFSVGDDYTYNLVIAVIDENGNMISGDVEEEELNLPKSINHVSETKRYGEKVIYYDIQVVGADNHTYYVRGLADLTGFVSGLFFDTIECDLSGRYPKLIRETRGMVNELKNRESYKELHEHTLWYRDGIWMSLYDEDKTLLAGSVPNDFDVPDVWDEGITAVDEMDRDYLINIVKVQTLNGDVIYLKAISRFAVFANTVQSWIRTIMIMIPVLLAVWILVMEHLIKKIQKSLQNLIDQGNRIRSGKDLKKRLSLGDQPSEIQEIGGMLNTAIGRLDRAFEQERRFSSDVAHELRNPLAAILGHSEYALDELEMSDEVREEVQTIYDKSNYLSGLVHTLLILSRMEQNRYTVDKEKLELNTLCSNICEDLQGYASEKGISLSFVPAASDVKMMGDMTLLIQAVSNLITNAVNYGKENGHVEVGVKQDQDHAHIYVMDDGIGISEENQKNLFERFFRADESRSMTKGFGLGLNMVKMVTKLHGGVVEVDSELGKGSTFVLTFPKGTELK